jgi:hypothetical protein
LNITFKNVFVCVCVCVDQEPYEPRACMLS